MQWDTPNGYPTVSKGKMSMNSRERVKTTLNHQQPDRVPIDCGGHRSSNFSIGAYRALRKYLGLEEKELYLYDVIQQLVIPDDDILDLFHIDVIDAARGAREDATLWKDWIQNDGTPVKVPIAMDIRRIGEDSYLYNRYGKPIAVQKKNSYYFDTLKPMKIRRLMIWRRHSMILCGVSATAIHPR